MMTPREMRGYRVEMGLSVVEVARWLEVPAAALRAYETGEIELPEVERFWRLIENTEWIRAARAEGR